MIDINVRKIAQEIKEIKIQGASKIELAAIGVIYGYIQKTDKEGLEFIDELTENINHLIKQRLNEPKLRNSLNYILIHSQKFSKKEDREKLIKTIDEYGVNIIKNNQKIVETTSQLITDGTTILTHCHSNLVEKALKKAHDKGINFTVYCTETRPRYQGRITAKALSDYGINTIQIVDSAVSSYLKKIDFFLTGADVIFSDGSVMNKIGTHTISIVANNFKTPHIVLTTTHCYESNDLLNIRGSIEERNDCEIWEKEKRPKNLLLKNPAFDITPNELIDKFITEVGVFSPESFSIWSQKKRF